MKTLFVLDGVVIGVGKAAAADVKMSSSIPGAECFEVPDDNLADVGWLIELVDGPQFTAPAAPAPRIGPIAFKMLFTSPERIAAKALRATDPVMEDFWGLLDDPRTSEVDLSLASVQNAIEYTLTVVHAAGVELDVAERKAAILTGIVQ
ncbi:MAG: hypothetical protein PHQ05_04970 [Sterolibacterium sp.]|nr:hypothetical protein [Sterolibacterium sp.]